MWNFSISPDFLKSICCESVEGFCVTSALPPLWEALLLEQGIQLQIAIAIHQKYPERKNSLGQHEPPISSGLSHTPQILWAASTALSLCRSQAEPQAALNTFITAPCTHFGLKLLFEVKYSKLLWLEFYIAGDFSLQPFTKVPFQSLIHKTNMLDNSKAECKTHWWILWFFFFFKDSAKF